MDKQLLKQRFLQWRWPALIMLGLRIAAGKPMHLAEQDRRPVFLSALFGSLLYRLIIAYATKYSPLPAYMLKLLSALIVALALSLPAIRERVRSGKLKKAGARDA